MGTTGASSRREGQALWERALTPVIVGGPLAGAHAHARASAWAADGTQAFVRAPSQATTLCPAAMLPASLLTTRRPCRPPAGMRAEFAAAGESHVLVVCALRSRTTAGGLRAADGPAGAPSGLPPLPAPDASTHRLVAWGCNGHGQLGCAASGDSRTPVFVAGINGRRVLHVAAGSTFSLAVCEHDPRDAAARWSRCARGAHGECGVPPATRALAAAGGRALPCHRPASQGSPCTRAFGAQTQIFSRPVLRPALGTLGNACTSAPSSLCPPPVTAVTRCTAPMRPAPRPPRPPAALRRLRRPPAAASGWPWGLALQLLPAARAARA